MTVKLLLTDRSKKITDICKSVERTLAEISALNDLSLTVELLENFDELSEEVKNLSIKSTVAVCQNSTETIYVNHNTFSLFPAQVQEAAIARAVAQAIAYCDSLMDSLNRYAEFGHFSTSFLADYLACKWGFLEGLRTERVSSYGQHYVEALDKWHDEDEYLKAMYLWLVRKDAGHA